MLIVSQDSTYSAPGPRDSQSFSGRGVLTSLFGEISGKYTEKIFLGNIPLLSTVGTELPVDSSGRRSSLLDTCCSGVPTVLDQSRVLSRHSPFASRYIDPTPWFCSKVCTAIVGPYDVYMDRFHVTATYAAYLQNALAKRFSVQFRYPHTSTSNISAAVGPPSKHPISGRYLLLGGAVLGDTPVVKVEFQLSGNGLHNVLICGGTKSPYGWGCTGTHPKWPTGGTRCAASGMAPRE